MFSPNPSFGWIHWFYKCPIFLVFQNTELGNCQFIPSNNLVHSDWAVSNTGGGRVCRLWHQPGNCGLELLLIHSRAVSDVSSRAYDVPSVNLGMSIKMQVRHLFVKNNGVLYQWWNDSDHRQLRVCERICDCLVALYAWCVTDYMSFMQTSLTWARARARLQIPLETFRSSFDSYWVHSSSSYSQSPTLLSFVEWHLSGRK